MLRRLERVLSSGAGGLGGTAPGLHLGGGGGQAGGLLARLGPGSPQLLGLGPQRGRLLVGDGQGPLRLLRVALGHLELLAQGLGLALQVPGRLGQIRVLLLQRLDSRVRRVALRLEPGVLLLQARDLALPRLHLLGQGAGLALGLLQPPEGRAVRKGRESDRTPSNPAYLANGGRGQGSAVQGGKKRRRRRRQPAVPLCGLLGLFQPRNRLGQAPQLGLGGKVLREKGRRRSAPAAPSQRRPPGQERKLYGPGKQDVSPFP